MEEDEAEIFSGEIKSLDTMAFMFIFQFLSLSEILFAAILIR